MMMNLLFASMVSGIGTSPTPLPGPSASGGVSGVELWTATGQLGATASYSDSGDVLGIFTTGTAPRSLSKMTMYYSLGISNGTGSGTYDFTTTSGTVICSVAFTCSTMSTMAPVSSTCSYGLSASTTYQIRQAGKCTVSGQGIVNITAELTGPVASGDTTSFTEVYDVGLLAGVPAANAVLFSFTTQSAVTLTDVYYTTYYGPLLSGTATLNITNASGTSLCSVNYPCASSNTFPSGTASCGNVALAANTVYQFRIKTQCGTADLAGGNFTARMVYP